MLINPKHEKFAQLVASGMTAYEAYTQVGLKSPQNAPRLRNNELVAKRIEELYERNARKAEMQALKRDDLIEILTEMIQAVRPRLSEARPSDGLKAAEMLTKMCGWNQAEQVQHSHVELRVDAALLAQLRAGYAALAKPARAQLVKAQAEDPEKGSVKKRG
jgi:hypothetical protein